MDLLNTYLPLIWGAIISVGVLMYVLLDGFDLGVGILFLFRKNADDRSLMMNSIAPFWDGNETWLVLGGGGLFAAFPLAYSIIMPAMYIPVIFMLIALIFRGVAFEFRFKAETRRGQKLWETAFSWGSILAAFAQGLILGGLVQGIDVEGRSFAGGTWDWLSPFSVMTGLAVIAGYAMLGSTWLIMKTEDALQEWGHKITPYLLLLVLFFMAGVSVWMPVLHSNLHVLGVGFDSYMQSEIFRRWFTAPNIYFLAPVPVLVLLLSGFMLYTLEKRAEYAPFMITIALFVLGYIGLGVSLWPNVVPPGVTLWEAAAAPSSQFLLLIGVLMFLPLVLGYTAYIYYIFRGKVTHDQGYH